MMGEYRPASEPFARIRVIRKPGITHLRRLGAEWIKGKEVRHWFDEAAKGKRLPIPDIRECEQLADQLNIFIDRGERPPIRWPQSAANTKKYGRLFLQHLSTEKSTYEARIAGKKTSNLEFQVSKSMRLAEKYVQNLLKFYEFPIQQWTWHDDARSIEQLTKQAWGTAGREPRSRGPNDPLCIFVTDALNAIRIRNLQHRKDTPPKPLTPEAVSEALRGRRGIRSAKKEGNSRNAKRPYQ
jgi:hypothetical protein